MTLAETPLSVRSGALELEGLLHEGEGRLAALVLHPHPQFGGDMDNHVVVAACEAFAAAGATTLRFNFRGVGRSTGVHDGGRGEADDARAALAALREHAPGAGVVLAGYSFGAGVAAAVAGEAGLRALLLISPPVGFAPLPPAPPGLPTLVLAGDQDEFAPAEALRALAGDDRRLVLVAGARHAWWPGLEALAGHLSGVAAELARGGTLPGRDRCR